MSATEDEAAQIGLLVDRLREAGFLDVAEIGSGTVNRVIECRSAEFAVRLTADRGQWWVDGSVPGGRDWFDADTWLVCLSDAPLSQDPLSLSAQVEYFVDHREVLAAAAMDPLTWTCLKQARARRTRERLGLPPA